MSVTHWILVAVVYPALIVTAGWAAWRFLMPDGIKQQLAIGEYGQGHGMLATLTELPPVVWVMNHLIRPAWRHLRGRGRGKGGLVGWVRKWLERWGLLNDDDGGGEGYDDPPDDDPPPPRPAPEEWDDDPPRPGGGGPPVVPILGGDGAIAPDDWALVIGRVGGFEPEDDADLIEFFRGEAAGAVALGEAWGQVADHCLDARGLDPVSVQGVLEMADAHGEVAHHIGYALHRFLLVYGELMEAVADGLIIPHGAREWITGQGLSALGGGGGAPSDDGDGEPGWEE